MKFVVEIGEEQVELLAFFAGDEKYGGGETVRKMIPAGAGFPFDGLRPCRLLGILAIGLDLGWCGHVDRILLWRMVSGWTGDGFAF